MYGVLLRSVVLVLFQMESSPTITTCKMNDLSYSCFAYNLERNINVHEIWKLVWKLYIKSAKLLIIDISNFHICPWWLDYILYSSILWQRGLYRSNLTFG